MDSRKLYKLLLVVFTLHFVRSNQKGKRRECLRTIQVDAYNLIKPHVEKYESCPKSLPVFNKSNHGCIFTWTLNGNCPVLQDIQEMIKESSKKCTYKLPLQHPENCTSESFMICWCGFLSKDFLKRKEKPLTNMFKAV